VCLDGEASIIQPRDHLVVSSAMDIDLHRVPAVALGLQLRLIANMETEEQRSARPKHQLEVREDRTDLIAGDVDQRVPSDQASHRGVGEREVRHGAEIEPDTGVVTPCPIAPRSKAPPVTGRGLGLTSQR
jgi:hypothetical protein